MKASDLFAKVLDAAITELRRTATPVFTFAFYHDHESAAVSVCVDTEENSRRFLLESNRYVMRYFMKAVAAGDLDDAGLWQANVGRSLSLGDFALVNIARTDLGRVRVGKQFHLSMVRALMAVQPQVASLAHDPERLAFARSGPDSEVALVWCLPDDA